MGAIYLRLLIIMGTACAQNMDFILNTTKIEIHVGDDIEVPFTLLEPEDYNGGMKILGKSSDDNIATVETSEVIAFVNGTCNSSIKVHGVFLGKCTIEVEVMKDTGMLITSEELNVTVIRPTRVIDTLFTVSVATLVSILYINFGCAMDWSVCRETLWRPIGPLIGGVCQFLIMPLLSFGIGRVLFPDNPEMQIGIFFTGISPSGGASNIWTVLLEGNLNLSIAMTTLSTIAAFATIPLWIFTLGKYIFDQGHLVIPYNRIGYIAVSLVVPLGIGYFVQKKFPTICRLMVRILKPCSAILILFIVTFAIITNMYLFKLLSWRIMLTGMGLPWLGFLCGWFIMTICQQSQADIRAISIETGIQNAGIAIFLLRFSLEQPAADLTTVIPVACSMMTPIPLVILWLINGIISRRKSKYIHAMQKLQDPISVTTAPSSVISN